MMIFIYLSMMVSKYNHNVIFTKHITHGNIIVIINESKEGMI